MTSSCFCCGPFDFAADFCLLRLPANAGELLWLQSGRLHYLTKHTPLLSSLSEVEASLLDEPAALASEVETCLVDAKSAIVFLETSSHTPRHKLSGNLAVAGQAGRLSLLQRRIIQAELPRNSSLRCFAMQSAMPTCLLKANYGTHARMYSHTHARTRCLKHPSVSNSNNNPFSVVNHWS